MTPIKKKILITGGNGLLGSNTARLLHKQGYDLRLLIRSSANQNAIKDIPCELFYGDICRLEDVQHAAQGCDYVVHAASLTTQWGISYDEYKQVNIVGTKNIVEACLLHKVEKLIYVSTANTIGPGTINKPGNELNAFSLFHINSGYINSKYIAQQYVQEQVERHKLPAVILNPTFMIGPNDIKPSSGQIILHGMNKRVLFYPPGGKNFVHVDDVCRGINNALEKGKTGAVYLLAGENLSYKDFFTLLNKIARQKPVMIRIPPFILKLAGRTVGVIGKATGYHSKLSYAAAYMLCLSNYYSGEKSERELNLSYTPTEKAVRQALEWFKTNGYL